MDTQNSGKRGHQQHQQHSPAAVAVYRECLRNHAAALGTHATDGCGEFIASPSSDPSDPTSLTCAACGCHRNFHRRVESVVVDRGRPSPNRHRRPQDEDEEEEEEAVEESRVLLTLKTGCGGPTGAAPVAGPTGSDSGGERGRGRKRFRSRFSREQKEGMMELAERLGWRLQRRDEYSVAEGCRMIGVDRAVFKVWMHNNKQSVLEMKNNASNNKLKQEDDNYDNGNGTIHTTLMNGAGGGGNCSSSSPSPPN